MPISDLLEMATHRTSNEPGAHQANQLYPASMQRCCLLLPGRGKTQEISMFFDRVIRLGRAE
jgi:hypothetical protein